MGPYGESRPLRRHVQTGPHAECQHQVIITKSPPGPPLLWSPRQTNGILPAVLQQQLVQQSSVQIKLLASSPASQGPSPPVAPFPAPFRLDSPGDPAPRVRTRTAAGTRVPASPADSRRPRGRRRRGQGEGRPRPAGPRGGRTPPPGPAAFPPSPFEQRPPAFLLRPAPAPSRGRTAAATPVPGSAPGLGRDGPGAPPGQCRGRRAAGGDRSGPPPPRGGGPAQSRGDCARRYLHLARPDPASAPPTTAILEKERRARAAREPQSSPERRLRLVKGNPGGESADRIECTPVLAEHVSALRLAWARSFTNILSLTPHCMLLEVDFVTFYR